MSYTDIVLENELLNLPFGKMHFIWRDGTDRREDFGTFAHVFLYETYPGGKGDYAVRVVERNSQKPREGQKDVRTRCDTNGYFYRFYNLARNCALSWEEKMDQVATRQFALLRSDWLGLLADTRWTDSNAPHGYRYQTFKTIYDADRAGKEWCCLPGNLCLRGIVEPDMDVVKHYLRLQSDGKAGDFNADEALFTRYCEMRFALEERDSAGTDPFAMLETPERSCSPTPYMPEQLSVDRRFSAHDEDSTSKYTTVPIKRELKSETDDSERFSRFMIKREPESESDVASESDFEREPDVLGPETPEKEGPSLKRELRQSPRLLAARQRARIV